MIIGIVGSEEAKFTPLGKERAKEKIWDIVKAERTLEVWSGGCHLGGIDIWAKEITLEVGKPFKEFLPKNLTWSGGYKERNLQIAKADIVYCITVDKLPEDFHGMKFEFCYHCGTKDHVKSGGCWTMKKSSCGILSVIRNF
jgi:hypothetical protein